MVQNAMVFQIQSKNLDSFFSAFGNNFQCPCHHHVYRSLGTIHYNHTYAVKRILKYISNCYKISIDVIHKSFVVKMLCRKYIMPSNLI